MTLKKCTPWLTLLIDTENIPTIILPRKPLEKCFSFVIFLFVINNWRDSSMSSKHFLDISLALLSFKYFHSNYLFVKKTLLRLLLLEVYESFGHVNKDCKQTKVTILCSIIKLTYHVTKHFNTSPYKLLSLCWTNITDLLLVIIAHISVSFT